MISFADKHPELTAEWDESNAPLTPWDVSYGSNKKVMWRCKEGHRWATCVKHRSRGCGCPICNKRQAKPGIDDLATACPELASEWSEWNDKLKPSDVKPRSSKNVWWKCSRCGYEWRANIVERVRRGSGCPYCARRVLKAGYTDLATVYPEIATEWSEKNENLKPTSVWPTSRKIVWWKCKTCGYEWQAVIYNRVKGEAACPSCSDRVVNTGFNDLETLYPDLLSEWDYEKNTELTPDKVLASSRKYVYWKDYYGHTWRAKVYDRVMGMGCPYCEPDAKRISRLKSIVYYVKKAGLKVILGSDKEIGIPLEIYVPAKKTAIEISGKRYECKENTGIENAKNWLCLNAGITLYRIVRPMQKEFDNCRCISIPVDNYLYFEMAVRFIFASAGIDADIDIARDYSLIMETELKEEKRIYEEPDFKGDTTGTWNTALAGNLLPHKQKTRRL